MEKGRKSAGMNAIRLRFCVHAHACIAYFPLKHILTMPLPIMERYK